MTRETSWPLGSMAAALLAGLMSGCGHTPGDPSPATTGVDPPCGGSACDEGGTPVPGACGSAHSTTAVSLTAPSADLCANGTTPSAVSTSTDQFAWTCAGIDGSTVTASCSLRRGYTLTASASGANGSITQQPSGPIAGGEQAVIELTTTSGYVPTVGASSCPSGALSGGDASWTYATGPIGGDCAITFTFEQPPTDAACDDVDVPETLIEVDTPMAADRMQRKMYSPSPDVVYAFEITVPPDIGDTVRSITATKTTSSQSAKYLVISPCKGDYSSAGKDAGCYGVGTEVSSVSYATGYSTSVAPPSRYCHLTPGQVYWVNVASRINPTGELLCSSSLGCSFYFESN